ncbi:MAG TPA: PIG-L family deacetylase [Ramlibacter sp.]|uniref:PIG-L deacetylase family protein n=1 Tax=Ramlibacter sp. TaxID=1917967 RepID=UPI002ED1CBBA
MRPAPALFIQPHYDDVALSCGGTAARFASLGLQPRIVTVFASEVLDAMVGPFAEWKHERWGLEDAEAVAAARREEDACASAVLGCDVRWLGLPDAIYRGDRYASDADLYGGLHAEELAFAEHLCEELMHLPEWRPGNQVFVPLAVGAHVDHQIAFETGRVLARRGVEVWAYEDLPYAIHTPQGVARRLEQVGDAVEPAIAAPVAESMDTKLESVACYASQLPVIFRFRPDFRAALADHASAVGAGEPAERMWRVRG